jgi:hypothetical protein
MDDETTAPAEAKRTKRNKHLPHEIVTEILLHLPVTSLLRFRRVCKAWLGTIANDPSFGGAHLRLHHQNKNRPYLLIASQIEAIDVEDDDDEDGHSSWESGSVATAGLYTWEEVHNTATLMHPMGTLPAEVAHDLAHCNGLVLAPTESRVRVINPATHRVLTLPLSLGGVAPRRTPSRSFSHQAFGLGHDPRSDTYKVARFFHRTERNPMTATATFPGWRCSPSEPVTNIGGRRQGNHRTLWCHGGRRPSSRDPFSGPSTSATERRCRVSSASC